jgi:hypothetical protein
MQVSPGAEQINQPRHRTGKSVLFYPGRPEIFVFKFIL